MSSLARFKAKLQERANAARKSAKVRRERLSMYMLGGSLAGGALIGALPRMGVPVAIMNVPIKAVVGLVAYGVQATTSGKMQALAEGVTHAAAATYAERAVATKSLIAGDSDDENADGTFSI